MSGFGLDLGVGLSAKAGGFGPELVSNPGGPFVDTTGWTASTGSVSVSGGILTHTAGGASSRMELTLSGLTIGLQYKVIISARRGGVGTNQAIQAFTWATITSTGISTSSFADYIFTPTATATSGLIRIYGAGAAGALGDKVDVQSVSVKQVL